jgi:DNA-binding CsgD family transcriptional regulator
MPKQPNGQSSALSSREREVIVWAAQGKSAREVGKILGITKRTVDHHTQMVVRKLGAINKTQAVVLAIKYGIISS